MTKHSTSSALHMKLTGLKLKKSEPHPWRSREQSTYGIALRGRDAMF